MHIAVTGATGFLGRHVIPAIVARGAEVTVMLRPGSEPKPWLAGLRAVQLDLHDRAVVNPLQRLGNPDAVIHLAWNGLPNYKSLHHFSEELPAQFHFLRQLVEGNLARLVVTGTCFEYGMRSGPIDEDAAPQPDNPYGYAKDCLRQQLTYLKGKTPFALVWARLFYMYGPGQSGNSLLPQFERAIADGAKTFNMSGGEQLRDYLPVATVAHDIVSLAMTQADVGVVNVCAGKPTSVRRLVEGWVKERGADIVLNLGHYAYPDYEPMAFWGGRRKLDAALASAA